MSNKKTRRAITSQEQLERIGVANSVPASIMGMLDYNRAYLGRIQKALNEEPLVLTNEETGVKYVNPTFTLLEKTQRLIIDTMGGSVRMAEIIEKNRLRPIDETPKERETGVQIEYHDYSQSTEPIVDNKEPTPKEKMEQLKQEKLAKQKGSK